MHTSYCLHFLPLPARRYGYFPRAGVYMLFLSNSSSLYITNTPSISTYEQINKYALRETLIVISQRLSLFISGISFNSGSNKTTEAPFGALLGNNGSFGVREGERRREGEFEYDRCMGLY